MKQIANEEQQQEKRTLLCYKLREKKKMDDKSILSLHPYLKETVKKISSYQIKKIGK